MLKVPFLFKVDIYTKQALKSVYSVSVNRKPGPKPAKVLQNGSRTEMYKWTSKCVLCNCCFVENLERDNVSHGTQASVIHVYGLAVTDPYLEVLESMHKETVFLNNNNNVPVDIAISMKLLLTAS